MWLKFSDAYQLSWEKAKKFILAFPTTYMTEKVFRHILHMSITWRNQWKATASGAIRLKRASIKTDVIKLVQNHQAQ